MATPIQLNRRQSQSLSGQTVPSQAPQTSSQTASQTNSQSATATPLPSIAQNAPPGVVLVTQPPEQSAPVYKIAPSAPITFGWNFSDVIVTPTHLTVSAACDNGNTYPVGPSNGIIPGSATSVVWDAYVYQTSNPQLPLAQAGYTLEIWGDQGPSAQPTPGYLLPNSAVRFSLYTPQGNTPLASGCAPVCSGGVSQYTYHPAFVGLTTTLLVVLLSASFVMRRL